MPSFDDAVSGAFGRRAPVDGSEPSLLPPVKAVVEPPHEFHGPDRVPPLTPDEHMPTIIAPRREDRPRPRGRPPGSKKRHCDEVPLRKLLP